MSESESLPVMLLVNKLVAISKDIGFLEFDGTNPVYNRGGKKGANYATAAGAIRKLNVAFGEAGILVRCISEDVVFVNDKLCYVTAMYEATDGVDVVRFVGSGSGTDMGDKAVMKASTAAYKYALAHLLTLGWGAEDPEADFETDKAAKASRSPANGSKPKGRRSARRAAKADTEAPGDVLGLIAGATTAEELASVHGKVVALRDAPEYTNLIETFEAKKVEIANV